MAAEQAVGAATAGQSQIFFLLVYFHGAGESRVGVVFGLGQNGRNYGQSHFEAEGYGQ